MTGALALAAGWVGFACLAYMAKGEAGTGWAAGTTKGGSNGKISPGPIIGMMLRGDWPYGTYIQEQALIFPGPTGKSSSAPLPKQTPAQGQTV